MSALQADRDRLEWLNRRIGVLLDDAEHLNLEARELAKRVYASENNTFDRGQAGDGAHPATDAPPRVASRPDITPVSLPRVPGGTPSTSRQVGL